MSEYPITKRTELTRSQYRGRTDKESIHAMLDANRVGSVAWSDESGQPFILPVAYARDGERILFHGSTGGGGLRALAAGAKCCFNVFRLDALVLARSGFESSMRYRSVSVLGVCEVLEKDAKAEALDLITEHLFPERTATLRPMQEKEIAATLVLALPIVEVSAKVSDGWPKDEAEDINWPVWAGIVPIEQHFGTPQPVDNLLAEFRSIPEYLNKWQP